MLSLSEDNLQQLYSSVVMHCLQFFVLTTHAQSCVSVANVVLCVVLAVLCLCCGTFSKY